MQFTSLFTPLHIGPMTVKNRFVVPAMSNNFALPTGCLSDESVAYYAERARGGFGLITIEATVVERKAKGGPRKSCIFDDSMIDGFRSVAEACHAYGAKVSVQLQHAGPEGNAKAAGYPLRSASAIPAACGRDIPIPYTTEEVYALVDLYADAAERAMKAGLDAVEIHCAHGYLLSSFISPRTNKRTDEFGGSFENRMRLPKLIIEAVQARTEGRIAVLARINGSDEAEGGIDVHDSAAVAAYLEECGVDALNVSRSIHLMDEYMWAPTAFHAGFNADQVTEIRRAVKVPLITVGRYTEPYFAELMVREGRCDMVAFGRQSIADPHMPELAREGRLEEMLPCIGCLQGCVRMMMQGQPLTCLVNPGVGHEKDLMLPKAETPKKVLVVGGGVGGMCAAFTAAERGHEVKLVEKSEALGGQMTLAAYPPGKGDITCMVRAYIVRCEEAGVNVLLNTEATPEFIAAQKPDALILATGAQPFVPEIPGIHEPFVLHAADVLAGKAACGAKTLVIGGGMVGCELADYLAERGHDVTVLEMRDALGADVIVEHRKLLMRNFTEHGVKGITGAAVTRFVSDGVEYRKNDREKAAHGFDSVVLALGSRSYNPLYEACKELAPQVFVIGDAVRARRALDATREAYDAAMSL